MNHINLSSEELQKKSEELRNRIIDYHRSTGKGHLGPALGSIEITTTLYYKFMNKDDSFILSKGHGSSAQYLPLNDLGFIPDGELPNLEEHPKLNINSRIQASTGSLGHGLSLGVGMALADPNNKVFILLGDGECEEGQVWEAVDHASELNLTNLKAIVDCNGFQGFKASNFQTLEKKFESHGWEVINCDGHSCESIIKALELQHEKPLAILAKTIKGKGLETEGTLASHYYHFPEEK